MVNEAGARCFPQLSVGTVWYYFSVQLTLTPMERAVPATWALAASRS
jgi:hypothetical protein